jgi:membrane-associated phospholipid phosphatase
LGTAVETYARVGLAVSDSFISCWHAKFDHNLIRPITYIQNMIDPNWNTPDITDPVITPPFPEYTSGHSVQSGAAASVMTALFGDNYFFIDNTHVKRGLAARAYDSFYAAADEAAISRLYGGIHYRPAIEQGAVQGKCIGEKINALAWKN